MFHFMVHALPPWLIIGLWINLFINLFIFLAFAFCCWCWFYEQHVSLWLIFVEEKRLLDDDELGDGGEGSEVEYSSLTPSSHSTADSIINNSSQSDTIMWTYDEAVTRVGFGRYQYFLWCKLLNSCCSYWTFLYINIRRVLPRCTQVPVMNNNFMHS